MSRVEFQYLLEELLGNKNVYFQSPGKEKIKYPCIIYHLDKIKSKHADNNLYSADKCYNVMLIHKDPDNEVYDKLLNLPKSSFDRFYTADNLNHYVFNIYI